MQHLLQVSRKVDYALRAMIYLASRPEGSREPLQDVARKNNVPREFLAKILKVLGDAGLVSALRGPGGGISIGRPPRDISFLDVIEAVEGPVVLNLCLDDSKSCTQSALCTMQSVWKEGQNRMLDVYRTTKLSDLTGGRAAPMTVPLGTSRVRPPARSRGTARATQS